MKKILSIILVCALILSGCGQSQSPSEPQQIEEIVHIDANDSDEAASGSVEDKDADLEQQEIPEDEIGDSEPYEYEVDFESLDDNELLSYIEDDIYNGLVEALDSDQFFVENVRAAYISQEYIDELTFNSQPNIYFGYTLAELDDAFQGTRYVFTLGDDGETIVTAFEEYDDTYEKVIKNVAIGTGVILVCVTVSVVTGGAGASAVSMVFAASAKTGTIFALSSGGLSAVAAGVTTGIQTHDMEEAKKAAALVGSESFKWGAITGAVLGGTTEAIALTGATMNGLTMNEAAAIQKESKYPVEVIKQFHTTEEYEVFKKANLSSHMINGKTALIRSDIDLNLVDEYGRTNLRRMELGLAPLDANGISFELHHIGQEADATLAILTRAEHDNAALHGFKSISEVDHKVFATQRRNFWKTMATVLETGGV